MPIPSRVLAVLAIATGLTFTACSKGPDIASVNGQGIPRAEFDAKVDTSTQAKGALFQLVQGALIEQYAASNHIAVSDAEVTKREDEIKARYPAGQFDAILKQQNLTEADVRKILRQQVILAKAVDPTIKITDAEIKSYLDKQHAVLDTQAQVRARHILVADQKTANDIEAKLKAGAKFEDMAKQYSTDPSTKVKGGELGFFSKTQMVPAFANAAFSQAVGAIGPPVHSPFGWHIIQVEEKKPATVATFANSKDKISERLKQQQESLQIPILLNTMRAKANIVINDPLLQDALPPLPPAPLPASMVTTAPSAARTAASAAASPAPAATK
jgi:foldase protein PrsA